VKLVAKVIATASEAAIPSGSCVPLRSGWSPQRLLSDSSVGDDAISIGFRQPITADPLRACTKPLVYSLSTSTP